MIKKLFTVCLIVVPIWLSAFTFYLFPWGQDMEWWYIPHALTAIIIPVYIWGIFGILDTQNHYG